MERFEKGFTHGGKFHADDVFAAALLTIINPDFKVERGFEVPENFDGIVFDIGFGEFDHHQADKKVRENEVAYAAFGLIFERFGGLLMDEEDKAKFDERFVQPLDINDNTGEDNEIAKLISRFNPSWDEEADTDEYFEQAKQFAMTILNNEIRYYKSSKKAKQIVEQELSNAKDGILVLSQYIPWKKAVEGTDIEFVIYPSKRGGYCAQGVPKQSEEEGKEKLSYDFPEEWRGKTKEELPEISGIKTLSFCHNSGFLLSAGTVEDCIKACDITRELVKKEEAE
ncbi:MAG: MYG1 family protein [Lachnospiraceae bacterium]|nr:MYG1 family protein [Lachnospiraceae bacterium]